MCIKHFKYNVELQSVLFTMIFLRMVKRFALIRSHSSTTNTVFPMQNLSLGWFLSWQGLRSSTSARNVKERTISLTPQLRFPIIYSTSQTLTRSPIKNRSCVSSSPWTQPATLCFHDPELLSGWKFQKEILWCVEKKFFPWFPWHIFSSMSPLPPLGSHPSIAPSAGCPGSPPAKAGLPIVPCVLGCGSSSNSHYRGGVGRI